MKAADMTLDQFRALPQRGLANDVGPFDSLVILPAPDGAFDQPGPGASCIGPGSTSHSASVPDG